LYPQSVGNSTGYNRPYNRSLRCRKLVAGLKYWEIIADNLSKAGWSWGWVSAVDSQGARSSLLTHIAMIESGSSCVLMKS
jgi:hypothetical protein